MRDWNGNTRLWCIRLHRRLKLPYEGLKHFFALSIMFFITSTFVASLWGIETPHTAWLDPHPHWVCSFPMRDWNGAQMRLILFSRSVCSFPMRDWNASSKATRQSSSILSFVASLWGIETIPHRSKQAVRLAFVASLWGIETSPGTGTNTIHFTSL